MKIIIVYLLMILSVYSQAQVQNKKPFERDLKFGYLLNYFFMSPKPYPWSNENFFLSGWDVDSSGGTFSYSPTGKFNIEWFRLEDNSDTKSVTISHQIARQKECILTLEFRFMMPKQMDYACWQLKDMTDAGISLTTIDNKLYAESESGRKVNLGVIEPNIEYGVQVVVDLVNHNASYLVNGLLIARNIPFLNPIKTIDFFSAKTGDQATGQMYFNCVNIYKGYSINETFVSCGAGILPENWIIKKGAASVEKFECGTKPDIFSLLIQPKKLDKEAQVLHKFIPLKGKIVCESRFLLPDKTSNASFKLVDNQNFGIKIIMKDEKMVLIGPKNEEIILASILRTNFWYILKIIADQKSGKADIYVNGKIIAKNIAFSNNALTFETLFFSSYSKLWIDDVQLYPWSDYPEDYVPEPQPATLKENYILGVQSCNLWKEGRSYAGWDYIYPYRQTHEPYLGWYDEGNPEVVDWEIKWKLEHGIGFEMHCWYRPDNAVNNPIKDGVLDQNIINGFFNARYSYMSKFAIMCVNEGACLTNFKDFQENIIPYWIEYFFKDPRYMTIDDMPLLSIYNKDNWIQMFGGEEGGRKAILLLREEVKKAGFPGIVVIMEDRWADVSTLQTKKDLGVDACYAYTWTTGDVKVEKARMVAQRDSAKSIGLPIIPSISVGWDRIAWGLRDEKQLSVNDYKNLANWTKEEFMPSLPVNSIGKNIVLLANWNEFGEGHYIMPSTLAGFGYLDALREVFTIDTDHLDIVPTKKQKNRFTVLFPKE